MAEPVIAKRAPMAASGLGRLRTATLRLTMLGVLVLAGCTTDEKKGLCPDAAILAATSSLTVFRQNAPQDPSGELYTVWMSDVRNSCDFDKDALSTKSDFRIRFKATRAPSNEAGTYRVPYFVAVTHKGSRIMEKKILVASVSFAPGEVSSDFEETVDQTVIKIARGNKVGEYQILVGFQLTQAQLDYNVKNNHFAGP